MIQQAYNRAKEVLTTHRALLDAIAAGLLERETLIRDDFDRLLRGEPLAARVEIPTNPPTVPPAAVTPEPRRPAPGLLGGPEPSPA